MEHRRGQRWQIELPIRIRHQDVFAPLQALLLELSSHGARIRLFDWDTSPGEVIGVWLPDRCIPLQALVVHTGEWGAGLLWIDREAWLEYLLNHPIASSALQSIPIAS
jgi:hypothetical protein